MVRKTFRVSLACLIVCLLTSCAAAAPAQPTLTFHTGGCTYQGPAQLPQSFKLKWVVEPTAHPGAIVLVVTLAPGKTVRDLAVMPAEDPPPEWVNKLVYDVALQPGAYARPVNLEEIAAYPGGPIYFACFFTDLSNAIGAAGPIGINK